MNKIPFKVTVYFLFFSGPAHLVAFTCLCPLQKNLPHCCRDFCPYSGVHSNATPLNFQCIAVCSPVFRRDRKIKYLSFLFGYL
mmetsp:Transcript_11402/g.21966  ORF Transcript_11402/g.21966 Transcript_11402/m.21966 type:complete len:83 (+) Transcript_11402:56-304(+)